MTEYFISNEQDAFRREKFRFRIDPNEEMNLVKVYPDITFQEIMGFGASFTESSAYVFATMSPESQDEFLRLCFGEGGNNYTLCRTHIQSCDFSLGNNAYVTDPRDKSLSTFSIEHDRRLLLPFIQCALVLDPSIEILASPWSPPAFMKTTKRMNGGGKLKRSYYTQWAQMIVRYLKAYAVEGIRIGRISVQNEPQATQTWESCVYTAEEEASFAVNHLRPALDEAGFQDVELFVWDHNKDCIIERLAATFAYPGADKAIQGIAYHWYSGDHFEALEQVVRMYPDKELLHTEGCVEYSNSARATQNDKAERYAHDMIGDLKAGAQGYIDWNVLLDAKGGPNHVGNFCDAPLMYEVETDTLAVNQSFNYIGHFSRFVKKGARRCLVSSYSGVLETVAFVNPDGSRVVVVLNRSSKKQSFKIMEHKSVSPMVLPPHSIMTICWE